MGRMSTHDDFEQGRLFDDDGLPDVRGVDGLPASLMLKLSADKGVVSWAVNGVSVTHELPVEAQKAIFEAIRPYIERATMGESARWHLLWEWSAYIGTEMEQIGRMHRSKQDGFLG